MIRAFLLFFVLHSILAEEETVRTARAFRNIPPNILHGNTNPSYNIVNHRGPGTYAFGYEVEDPRTGNLQFRDEEKLSDGSVRGAYGVLLPNGEVVITKYVADAMGYRTEIERHNVNEALQNYNPNQQISNHHVFPVGQVTQDVPMMPYSIPDFSNNQLTIQTDSSTQNGAFGWFGALGQNLQNVFRPPQTVNQQSPNQGPLSTLFRPITNFLYGNPSQSQSPSNNNNNNQGPLISFFQNIPFIGGGGNNNGNNPNYNNVEQFSPVQAEPIPIVPPSQVNNNQNNDYFDYDIPIIRPLAVNTYKPQVMPGYDTTQHTYSNLLRVPPSTIPIGTPVMIIPSQMPLNDMSDGWFKKMIKRRRLQQQLKKEAKKEIKATKKIIRTQATPGFGEIIST